MTNYFTHLGRSAQYAVIASLAIVSLLLASFFVAEPTVSRSQAPEATDEFYVRQTITGENSFTTDITAITMNNDIAGLTGGNATGSASFVVLSNNSSGYYVDISFENNAGKYSMIGDETGSESIRDYPDDGSNEPTLGWTASTAAMFAYTVLSSTTADTDDSFDYSGTCNQAAQDNADGSCWKAATSTTGSFRIIDTSSPTPVGQGSTSTIKFRVIVPSGADPVVVTDTYTATATLSLYIK